MWEKQRNRELRDFVVYRKAIHVYIHKYTYLWREKLTVENKKDPFVYIYKCMSYIYVILCYICILYMYIYTNIHIYGWKN